MTNGTTAADSTAEVASAVTALFVPGDRPDRFAKATSSGADVVIIDLEDAVDPSRQAQALAATVDALGCDEPETRALVRVNALDSAGFQREVDTLMNLAGAESCSLLGLVVPKAEDSPPLRELLARCDDLSLAVVLLVETALGVLDAPALARTRGVTRLAFGAIDYALDIDAQSDDRFLDYARSALVVSSRAAGKPGPLDSPSISIKDTMEVAASARVARGFGFTGKLCIHPIQLSIVTAAFMPTDEELDWARLVLSAGAGAAQIAGQMIDRPVIARAHRIIRQRAKES